MTSTQKNMLRYITIRLMWKTDRGVGVVNGRGEGKQSFTLINRGGVKKVFELKCQF